MAQDRHRVRGLSTADAVHGEQLDAAEVDQLAKLMNKLRHEGLATLVQINSDENKP